MVFLAYRGFAVDRWWKEFHLAYVITLRRGSCYANHLPWLERDIETVDALYMGSR